MWVRLSPRLDLLYTSHVSWKRISLDSPTIWVIDLDVVAEFSEEERNEILRRTGESLLCIMGNGNGWPRFPRGASGELFLLFYLHIELGCERWSGSCLFIQRRAWRLLEMPMENLEFFSLALRRPESDKTTMRETLFFGGAASKLHALRIKYSWCNLQASWFSNIWEFYLNSALLIPGLLEALNSNGLFEALIPKNLVDAQKSSEQQVVDLPIETGTII